MTTKSVPQAQDKSFGSAQDKPIPIRLKPAEFESKWQKIWEEKRVFSPDMRKYKNPFDSAQGKPYYNLMMFPYPSAEGLHVGNMYAFTGVDVHGRFKRMQGHDVFEPIGLDGFGIHSENYALKVNRHPKEQVKITQKNYYQQLRAIGNGFDWSRTLETYDPNYYKWTQWLFIEMFKHGLAYRAKAEVNWCPTCKTVLADEQVIDGKCERTGDLVIKKELEQWFFRITDYAERLLQNTYKPSFNWPEKVKIGQRNWIGKKEGINIKYQISNVQSQNGEAQFIEVFTTRPDTNFGATFIVISPEHPQVSSLTTDQHKDEVSAYITQAKQTSKEDRIAAGRKKTGAFTGSYAINNLTGEKMPIYLADFVLMGVGTGVVVGVPGHDQRDFEFAQVFGLPIKRVVVGEDGDTSDITKLEQVQEENGKMINSDFLNGLDIHDATIKIMDHIVEKGWGKRVVSYHLRDWLISRQRYWGAPIPMIHCKVCAQKGESWFTSESADKEISNIKYQISKQIGNLRLDIGHSHEWAAGWFPVSDESLPVALPDVENWRPTGTGRGPLAGVPSFYETKCPSCGDLADRETDVCDTFLDSAWYFLRYPSVDAANAADVPFDQNINKKWQPVHSYIGGAEHTVLHLLYARFFWMALRDWNLLPLADEKETEKYNPDEPFQRFFAHGLIIKDGAKMSKSKGNVVIPDEYIRLYGADTLRTYLMFLGPFEFGGDFRDTGIAGMYRWLSRVWRLCLDSAKDGKINYQDDKKLPILHKTIKGITRDMESLHYNTAIAKMMEFTNWWMDHVSEVDTNAVITFIRLLAPFAPFMTEELYQNIKYQMSNIKFNAEKFDSIHLQPWPTFDESLVVEDIVTVIMQVNGKLRDSVELSRADAKDEHKIKDLAAKSAKIGAYLSGKEVKKTIFVPGRLINFVI